MSKQKTWTAKAADLKGDWFVVDATDQVLGRLASSVAKLLRGKHKPTFTPHLNTGDHVIVINAAKIKVTGTKTTTKEYTRYSGYPGGLRRRTLGQAQEIDPTFPITNAVRGMLQRNTLGPTCSPAFASMQARTTNTWPRSRNRSHSTRGGTSTLAET